MTSEEGQRGRFITLEGGEGAGKSTQAQLLQQWLGSRGVQVVRTREPGGSPDAEAMRRLLLGGRAAPFGPAAEALLFAVARADHVAVTIAPALRAGQWVVCDRFMDSTRAYQGSSQVSGQELDRLERIAVGDLRPDLTLILDLPASEGLRRAGERRQPADRFERDSLTVHEARRAAFLAIAAAEPTRCAVIDASLTPEEVARAIVSQVSSRLGAMLPEPA
ncbi:thymidylate kinase [Faunimonas pinastri]|uniref:Thymidylate kinase n=1 Tax=Faunimonas pinastri TaxID=1855383 RepID=A0A1H9N686_9HYPH|nr:dTMP kinase [Faunimonas pinastri]SER31321.1 thymidylate kinase [Faunimonas pinastri]